MKKYLTQYRIYFRKSIESPDCDLVALLRYHERQIAFFQHERLVHLIVTVLFALCTIASLITSFCTSSIAFIVLSVAFLSLLIPYIAHYYFLENQTQALYDDYNELHMKLYGLGYESRSQRRQSEEL